MDAFSDMVKPTGYVAGTPHMTVADLSFLAIVCTLKAVGRFDMSAYIEINNWYDRMRGEVPDFDNVCLRGAESAADFMSKLGDSDAPLAKAAAAAAVSSSSGGDGELQIYGMSESAPCRVAMMACEMAGVSYSEVRTDLNNGDNMKPEFLKVIYCRLGLSQ